MDDYFDTLQSSSVESFLENYYTKRDETLRYKYRTSVNYGVRQQSYVDVDLIVAAPRQKIIYAPAFWEAIKNGWVVYFSSFIFFYLLLHSFFLNYIITNGAFETVELFELSETKDQ